MAARSEHKDVGDDHGSKAPARAGDRAPHLPRCALGAMLAAELGLPCAFASHFAPDLPLPALQIYAAASSHPNNSSISMRWSGSSSSLPKPTLRRGASPETRQMSFTDIFRGRANQSPIDDIESYWSPLEKAQALRLLARSIIGSRDTARSGSSRRREPTRLSLYLTSVTTPRDCDP